MLSFDKESVVVFDLDDTLYKEFDFLKSGYTAVSYYLQELIGINVFDELMQVHISGNAAFEYVIKKYQLRLTSNDLLTIYRTHLPAISLSDGALALLQKLRATSVILGMITDGRSVSQRNKIRVLKIEEYFDDILISEEVGYSKPHPWLFDFFSKKYQANSYCFIGDNYSKDFITPKKMGWKTIALADNGNNIHKFDSSLGEEFYPDEVITSLSDLIN